MAVTYYSITLLLGCQPFTFVQISEVKTGISYWCGAHFDINSVSTAFKILTICLIYKEVSYTIISTEKVWNNASMFQCFRIPNVSENDVHNGFDASMIGSLVFVAIIIPCLQGNKELTTYKPIFT